jgi:hypothetical protein
MSYTHDSKISDYPAGIFNLLHNCLSIKPQQRLLIIGEPEGTGYYEDGLCERIAKQAESFGALVSLIRPPLVSGPNDIDPSVSEVISQADHTVFLARLGDQVRFSEVHGTGSKTICYTLEHNLLDTAFGTVPWDLFKQIHDRLVARIASAQSYQITCPLGTQLRGRVKATAKQSANTGIAEFTVKPFPVLIYPPLQCTELNGQLVLDRYLASTSINDIENSILKLEQPVTAHIEESRIVGFDGDSNTVASVEAQYQRVGKLTDGDPYTVNSWHTGMYPKTFYRRPIDDDVQRWSDLAFGSPRYTHFHTCGNNPGNIATAMFDATIGFDDQLFWEAGQFVFLDQPEQQALLEHYPDYPDAFGMRWDIGI